MTGAQWLDYARSNHLPDARDPEWAIFGPSPFYGMDKQWQIVAFSDCLFPSLWRTHLYNGWVNADGSVANVGLGCAKRTELQLIFAAWKGSQ